MLKAGKAFVVRRTPFTIKLTIATGETKQDVTLGVDAGARHVGISATTEKEEVFASEVALRGSVRISVSGEVIPGAAQRGCPLFFVMQYARPDAIARVV